MRPFIFLMGKAFGLLLLTPGVVHAQGQAQIDADTRAAATEAAMTDAERTVLTNGIMPLPFPPVPIPPDALYGAGFVPGIDRLGVPPLWETDAGLGIAWVGGLRGDGATALPSAIAQGATWDSDLVRRAGAMIGGEARALGFNILLAGGINLMRDPRNGRTFEYFSEDPLLSGILGGAAVDGIQSMHVLSTVKHFALNGQETGRRIVDVSIGEPAARESDLLAFEIAIERGRPGSVMCAYNRVNGVPACGSEWLLNQVLKRDWQYPGFVMSDWGAVTGLDMVMAGLDQQSGAQLDPEVFLGQPLADRAATDPLWASRLSDMNRRILRSIFAIGLDQFRPERRPIDLDANAAIAEQVARQGIVLLRNEGDLLPLSRQAARIAVIGGHADRGVLAGGGSSHVQSPEGPGIALVTGRRQDSPQYGMAWHRSAPVTAIRAMVPDASVRYRDGRYISEAVALARDSDIVIIIATQWMTEGRDVPDLSLPDGQDELIMAVAEANPRTIVVLQTGGPVLMPWHDSVGAILAAWYPGARGGEAIASLLFGEHSPSGRLPVTFPAGPDQLPRPHLDGAGEVEPNFIGIGQPGQIVAVNYDIEGADVGYRWYAQQGLRPLFPFGFGLSYTRFSQMLVGLSGGARPTARVRVRNVGYRPGAEVVQLYLTANPLGPQRRLAGFERVELAPGEERLVDVALDPRLLGQWRDGGWYWPDGRYAVAAGTSALETGAPMSLSVAEGMPCTGATGHAACFHAASQ
ncbi:beta-glucosidase family protein [Sphingomonas lacunae]|nr:glycoside hydrolase family 3 C-terminal domain-containing protein [Sphingomonas lacunae]